MQPVWNKNYEKSHPTFRKDYYLRKKEKRDKYMKKWRIENKTYLKEYREKRRQKQIDDAFNDYFEYLQTIE